MAKATLGAIHIERDPAQLLDRFRGGYGFVQAKAPEHPIGPIEKLLVALRIGSRMFLSVLCRWRHQIDRLSHVVELRSVRSLRNHG